MELLGIVKPDQLLKLKWQDITFLVKPYASQEDKFIIATSGIINDDGSTVVETRGLYATLVRRFVVGWEGVTSEGKPVDYDFSLFSRLPAVPGETNAVFAVGTFIAENTDALGKRKDPSTEALKNA